MVVRVDALDNLQPARLRRDAYPPKPREEIEELHLARRAAREGGTVGRGVVCVALGLWASGATGALAR